MHDGQDDCQEGSEPQNPGLGQCLKVKIVSAIFFQLFNEAHAIAVRHRIVLGEMPRTYAQDWIIEENMPRGHVYDVASNDRRVRDPRLTLGGFTVTDSFMGKQGLDSSQACEPQRGMRIENQDEKAEAKRCHDNMKGSNETKIGQQSEDDHGGEHGSSREREHYAAGNKSAGRQGEPSQGTRALSSEPKSGKGKKYDQHLRVTIWLANRPRGSKLDTLRRTGSSLWMKVLRISPRDISSPPDRIKIQFRPQHREPPIIASRGVGNVLKDGEPTHKASGEQQGPGGPPQSRILPNDVHHQEINRDTFEKEIDDL